MIWAILIYLCIGISFLMGATSHPNPNWAVRLIGYPIIIAFWPVFLLASIFHLMFNS
jgi:hypothetical protein